MATIAAENEAMAKLRMIKTSPQKLNLVAQLIRNKPVVKALSDLRFSKKRVAKDVSSCLQSAIANAENNHGLDVDELFVQSAYVGKNMVLKRGRPRARGRYANIKIENTGVGESWRFGTFQVDLQPDGRRG